MAQVLDRALDALIADLEKRKLGAITRRWRRPGTTGNSRYLPAHVRRAVWERDQGQCTFVGTSGHRCAGRRFLEFDHVDPVARGGKATVEGIRLRCRAHNQFEAERVFGAGFMRRKRQEARLAAAETRPRLAQAQEQTPASEVRARDEAQEQTQDVFAGLRGLGCRAVEARRAAEFSATLHDATPEERMRAALRFLGRGLMQGRAPAGVRHTWNQSTEA